MNPLILAFNRQSQSLVTNWAGTTIAPSIPTFYATNLRDVQVYALDPTGTVGGSVSPYTQPNLAGYVLRVMVGPNLQGTGETGEILLGTLVWNPLGYFYGTLDFTQASITALVGAAAQVNVYMAFTLSQAGIYQVLYQTPGTNVVISAALDEGTSNNPPVPAPNYYTAAETAAAFVAKIGRPGEGIVLVSANNLAAVLLTCGNNGVLVQTPIPVQPPSA